MIDIACRYKSGISQHGRPDKASLKCAVAIAQQHHVPAGVGRGARQRTNDIELAVAVKIANRPSARVIAGVGERRGRDGRFKCAIPIAQQR